VVVKTPMDLGTVYQRLLATSSASNSQMAGYDHPGAAVRDVRLVWSNARLYNGRSSDVGKARSPTRGLASTGGGTRRVHLVREEGRDVSS